MIESESELDKHSKILYGLTVNVALEFLSRLTEKPLQSIEDVKKIREEALTGSTSANAIINKTVGKCADAAENFIDEMPLKLNSSGLEVVASCILKVVPTLVHPFKVAHTQYSREPGSVNIPPYIHEVYPGEYVYYLNWSDDIIPYWSSHRLGLITLSDGITILSSPANIGAVDGARLAVEPIIGKSIPQALQFASEKIGGCIPFKENATSPLLTGGYRYYELNSQNIWQGKTAS